MEKLDYNLLNKDIASITLEKNRIFLNKDLLTEKINLFSQGQSWGGNGGNNGTSNIELKQTPIEAITKDELKIQIIKKNKRSYSDTIIEIEKSIEKEKLKNVQQYKYDKEIINNINDLYINAMTSQQHNNWIDLHNSFHDNPITKKPYNFELDKKFTYNEKLLNIWQKIEVDLSNNENIINLNNNIKHNNKLKNNSKGGRK
jgi:hypothetical protein